MDEESPNHLNEEYSKGVLEEADRELADAASCRGDIAHELDAQDQSNICDCCWEGEPMSRYMYIDCMFPQLEAAATAVCERCSLIFEAASLYIARFSRPKHTRISAQITNAIDIILSAQEHDLVRTIHLEIYAAKGVYLSHVSGQAPGD